LLTGLLACGDEEKTGNTPPIAQFEFIDGIDRIILDGRTSTDRDGDPLTYLWTSSNGSIPLGSSGTLPEYSFKIPEGGSANVDVTLTVSDGNLLSEKTRTVDVPAFTIVRSYGLGKSLTHEANCNVNYEWYIDQSSSGPHSLVNCGPAAVTMAIKWFDQNFVGTAEDARNVYHPSGGWWYTNDIIAYLNSNGVYNRTIKLEQFSDLKTEIDAGNIIILCLDMYYVDDADDPEHHVNRFYAAGGPGWGHFMVVKGYKEIDGKVFYETYDPYSFSNTYSNGDLKGKDRYYISSDLEAATNIWWDYAIVVERTETPGGRKGVDVSQIVHKPGR